MGYALGLDLGTTFTAAAVSRGGRVEVVSLGNRAAVIPSLVFLRDDETMLVGDAAERRGLGEPRRLAREFKRRMGDATPIMLGSSPYSAERIMAALLRDVVAAVGEREGAAPDRVVVTHPANWGPYKTDLLRQAATMAGLREPVLITEPVAAALSYASTERVEVGRVVAVYDLGGGTFDAAVLRKTDRGFEQLGSPEGIERLGGIDFDEAVFRHVAESLGPSFDALDMDDSATRTAVLRLRQECVEAKEALSSDSDAVVPVILPGLQTDIRITRGEFESMIRPTLRETVEALRRALDSAGVHAGDLSAVLLVGGSSRIPLVAELVSAELGRPVAVDAHPKHAVALGAALLAAGLPAATTPAPSPPIPGGATPPPAPPPPTPPASPPPAAPAPSADGVPPGPPAGPPSSVGGDRTPPQGPPAHPAPRRRRANRVPVAIAVIGFVVAVGAGAYLLLGSSDDEPGAQSDTTPTQSSATTDGSSATCTSGSGRCAFLATIGLEGETYVAEYSTVGFDPIIYEPGVKGQPEDHHVHFFFNTLPEVNAGTNGPEPGIWEVWDRDAGGGELRFDAFTLANQADKGGDGATQLCVSVADADHGVEVGSGNCIDLPQA
jgi:molecular chaperone DnaK